MYKTTYLVLIALISVWYVPGQDDWHTYPFRDLATVIAGEQSRYDKTPKADMVVSAKPFPSKTRVIYTGKKRAVGEIGRSYMRIWAESRNVPAGNVELLSEEFLFLEQDKEYWLPVHKSSSQAITRDLKPGDEIIIYYFYLGGFNAKSLHSKHDSLSKTANLELDGIRWLFAVERVEKPGSSFQQMSLEEVIERNMPEEITDMWVDSRMVKAKVKVIFTGKLRDVSGKRGDLRDLWFQRQGAPGASQLMQSEGQFKAGNKEYWIILRNQTRDHLNSYVLEGSDVYLNVILAGALKQKNSVEPVFMSGEYSTF